MNKDMAKSLLKDLKSLGVSLIALCPGGRNAPFVSLLDEDPTGFEVVSFFDERSASFFALGRAQRDNKPAVVITTSGTAVTQLFSAVVEAYYTQTSLIVLTADRPRRLRGTGAPQVIEQLDVFSPYIRTAADIDLKSQGTVGLKRNSPIHINICFDEPLLDAQVAEDFKLTFNWEKPSEASLKNFSEQSKTWGFQKTLVVVGGLKDFQREHVLSELEKLSAPIYTETLSGLRKHPKIQNCELRGGDLLVQKLIESQEIDSLIRIGDVPVGKFWRRLDSSDLPVSVFSEKDLPGLEKAEMNLQDLNQLNLDFLVSQKHDFNKWFLAGIKREEHFNALVSRYPEAEQSLLACVQKSIQPEDFVYYGNSLPVRMANLNSPNSPHCYANRGANGIDGQISTALGRVKTGQKAWVILGDLTALYDGNGLWVTEWLKQKQYSVQLIVVNNMGGQIFNRIFEEKLFCNSHQKSLKPLADLWGWSYQGVHSPEDLKAINYCGLNFIELFPKNNESNLFWQGLKV